MVANLPYFREGKTALHCAILTNCQTKFIALLVHVGASLWSQSNISELKDVAKREGREDVAKLLDGIDSSKKRSSQTKRNAVSTITINGKEKTYSEFREYYSQVLEAFELEQKSSCSVKYTHSITSSSSREKLSPISGVETKVSRNQLLLTIITLNTSLFDQNPDEIDKWEGIIRYPVNNDCWVSEYTLIGNDSIRPKRGKPFECFSLCNVIGFQLYSGNSSRFSIQIAGDDYPSL